METSLINKKIT